MSRYKKGRSSFHVDNWLDSIGYYRKNVAHDETCLFRAVSEHLFECQIYHERVRKECVEFGRRNFELFEDCWDSLEEWFDHLEILENHMMVCGNIEMQIVSTLYNRDIVIFDAAQRNIINVTKQNRDKPLMLCLMNEDHFDIVYEKERIETTGFCQSLVYSALYENVFKIENVDEIVHKMLYEKSVITTSSSPELNNNEEDPELLDSKQLIVAPFPFKVAKALDPTIYRNIEYDSWSEIRRELRLGDWYYGDNNLILGTRCIFNDNGETFQCYIQDLIKSQNKCVVYITAKAEKRTVNYTDLSPENNAQPWPLPYRFSKSLVVSSPNDEVTAPKYTTSRTYRRRNKNGRRKSTSESSAHSQTVIKIERDEHDVIKSFIGAPLQMQPNKPPEPARESLEVEKTPETPISQHNLLITPDVYQSPMPRWDNPFMNFTPNWQQQPPPPPLAQGGLNMNFGAASVPVTPDAVCQAMQYGPAPPPPFFFPLEADPNWFHQHDSPEIAESACAANAARPQLSPLYMSPPNTTQPPPGPPPTMEVYSPMILPPGTPVYYTGGGEYQEVYIQTPPLFTPPIDVAYVYPPTPPPSWYPPRVTSQGFIFPTPKK